MTFLSLYQIVERQLESGSVLIGLDKDNVVFKVHFQGNPVLPGACMVEIARELLADTILNRPLQIRRIVNLKFLRIVSPLEFTKIVYIFDIKESEENQIHAKIQVTDSTRSVIFARISVVLS